MENEITEAFKDYVKRVYAGETLDGEQYKQVWLAFHAGAVVWLGLMLKLADKFRNDPDGGAMELSRLRKMLFDNCEEFTKQSQTIN